MFVHVGGTGDSVLLSETDELEDFSFLSHVDFGEVLDVRSDFILADLQVAFTDIEKITDLFHVELEDGYFEFVLD